MRSNWRKVSECVPFVDACARLFSGAGLLITAIVELLKQFR